MSRACRLSFPAVWAVSCLAALVLSSCGNGEDASTTAPLGSPPAGSVVLRGSGSPTAAPWYQELSSHLRDQDITINYRSEARPPDAKRWRALGLQFSSGERPGRGDLPGGLVTVEVPLALSAVVFTYNLPSARGTLKLDDKVLVKLYRGEIKRWNARAIQRLNPAVRLPKTAVVVLHRSDAASDTAALTHYLARRSSAWRKGPGVGTRIAWPGGVAVAGGDAMVAAVAQTPGSLGYVPQQLALQRKLPTIQLRNASGRFVAPTLAATSKAAVAGPDGGLRLTAHRAGAYPVVTAVEMSAITDPCADSQALAVAKGLKAFVAFALGGGQQIAERLSLAPLPEAVRDGALADVADIGCRMG
jgi:phosphate transport system substrate-binding protein